MSPPLPWESHGTHWIPIVPIPMHISNALISGFVTGRPTSRATCLPVLHLPSGLTKVKYVSYFAFIGQNCRNTAPKTVKISNFAHTFALHGRLVCIFFLQNSWRFVHVYRQLLSFQFRCFRGTNNQVKSNFPHVVGAFSHKFSIAPSGETSDRIKKVRGV